MSSVPPGVILLAAAALMLVVPRRLRAWAFVAAFVLVLVQLFQLETGAAVRVAWLGFELTPLRVDALSVVFAAAFALVGVAGGSTRSTWASAASRSRPWPMPVRPWASCSPAT